MNVRVRISQDIRILVAASECGGDDCDDADPARFPGNAEVCDTADHDEDCDPSTLGPDRDGDGTVASQCCNIQPDGTPNVEWIGNVVRTWSPSGLDSAPTSTRFVIEYVPVNRLSGNSGKLELTLKETDDSLVSFQLFRVFANEAPDWQPGQALWLGVTASTG